MPQELQSGSWRRRYEHSIPPNCPNGVRHEISRAIRTGVIAGLLSCFVGWISGAVPCFAQSAEPTPQQLGPGATQVARASTGLVTQSRADITYQNGLLTIDVHGATLAEVLRLVAQKTGAFIEIPPGAGLERIVEHIGPGPAKEVVSHLLNGSSYNFLFVNSPERPQDLGRVVLSLQRPETLIPASRPVPVTTASSALWTPPPNSNANAVVPARLDVDLTLPDDTATMTPEARGEFMKSKFNELREKAQQQYPH